MQTESGRTVHGLIIDHTEYMSTSRYGNPRYRVYFRDGSMAPTEPDGSVAYGINNSSLQNTPLEVQFNKRGHIVYVRPEGK